jgi:hypothetical protein
VRNGEGPLSGDNFAEARDGFWPIAVVQCGSQKPECSPGRLPATQSKTAPEGPFASIRFVAWARYFDWKQNGSRLNCSRPSRAAALAALSGARRMTPTYSRTHSRLVLGSTSRSLRQSRISLQARPASWSSVSMPPRCRRNLGIVAVHFCRVRPDLRDT